MRYRETLTDADYHDRRPVGEAAAGYIEAVEGRIRVMRRMLAGWSPERARKRKIRYRLPEDLKGRSDS